MTDFRSSQRINRSSRFTPVIVSVSVVIGILIGSFYANHFSGNRLSIVNSSNNKLSDLLHIIEDQYVDTINFNELIDNSLAKILRDLDPHSTYTPAKDAELAMEGLKSKFSGVGVEFIVLDDTVRIVKVLEGGPSESVGLRAGDRIISVDGKPFTGSGITEDSVRSTLKGADESVVKLGIKRNGVKGELSYTIMRGAVPIKSVDIAYMADKTTGYVNISSFSENTFSEFLAALAKLNSEGMTSLIIDLRGNRGGYMETAVQIANEFLPKNQVIVSIKGRKQSEREYRSDGRGTYQQMPLVVLIDELSASSSEILAGAIQDNDRGTVIGRRSFGKGLVQQPYEFSDGSSVRLTVARYYTASGRCVQRPYVHNDAEGLYDSDFFNRLNSGESFSKDSIKTSGEEYKTRLGRPVYGGGGIIPDIFIPLDTANFTSYYQEAFNTLALKKFAFKFVDTHRRKLHSFNSEQELIAFLKKERLPEQFATFGASHGLPRRNLMLRTSYRLIENQIIRFILDDVMNSNVAMAFFNLNDKTINTALTIIRKGETFPKAPAEKKKTVKPKA